MISKFNYVQYLTVQVCSLKIARVSKFRTSFLKHASRNNSNMCTVFFKKSDKSAWTRFAPFSF
jgi:hypothetical protein